MNSQNGLVYTPNTTKQRNMHNIRASRISSLCRYGLNASTAWQIDIKKDTKGVSTQMIENFNSFLSEGEVTGQDNRNILDNIVEHPVQLFAEVVWFGRKII